jgi:hypothetical protein
MMIELTSEEAAVFKTNVGIILNQHVRRESTLSPGFIYVLARVYDQLLEKLPLTSKPMNSAGAQVRKPVGSVRPVIEIDRPNRAYGGNQMVRERQGE